ncbi:MAG TPA: PAS domain S-box protein, partial [Firmicutes bacterium]|nr:PAS domain S-box protein [Bacillota bacterium]
MMSGKLSSGEWAEVSERERSGWLSGGATLLAVWVALMALLEGLLLQAVPLTAAILVLMTIPVPVGLGALGFLLSRANRALSEQNARLVQAERATAAAAAELETVLESMSEFLLVTDAEGRLVRTNKSFGQLVAERWFGRDVEALRREDGTLPILCENGRPYPPGQMPHERALAGETVVNETMAFKRRDGELVYYLVSSSPIREPGTGRVTGSVTLMRDISELKRLERLKDEFLYTVSHELRTPLTVIRGYAELSLYSGLAGDGTVDGNESALGMALQRIVTEVDQMSGLLEQMLQIARLDVGRVPIKMVKVDLYDLTAAELRVLSIRPEYARVVLDLEGSIRPVPCRVDQVAYCQVLGNLLSNALKYSPEGSPVEVRVWATEGQALVSVSDHGMGIPEDEVPVIFEKFYRASGAATSGTAGLGLGLYITAKLVELMGG